VRGLKDFRKSELGPVEDEKKTGELALLAALDAHTGSLLDSCC
jgi:hypothetical protein